MAALCSLFICNFFVHFVLFHFSVSYPFRPLTSMETALAPNWIWILCGGGNPVATNGFVDQCVLEPFNEFHCSPKLFPALFLCPFAPDDEHNTFHGAATLDCERPLVVRPGNGTTNNRTSSRRWTGSARWRRRRCRCRRVRATRPLVPGATRCTAATTTRPTRTCSRARSPCPTRPTPPPAAPTPSPTRHTE